HPEIFAHVVQRAALVRAVVVLDEDVVGVEEQGADASVRRGQVYSPGEGQLLAPRDLGEAAVAALGAAARLDLAVVDGQPVGPQDDAAAVAVEAGVRQDRAVAIDKGQLGPLQAALAALLAADADRTAAVRPAGVDLGTLQRQDAAGDGDVAAAFGPQFRPGRGIDDGRRGRRLDLAGDDD